MGEVQGTRRYRRVRATVVGATVVGATGAITSAAARVSSGVKGFGSGESFSCGKIFGTSESLRGERATVGATAAR